MSKINLREDFDDVFETDDVTYDTGRYEEIKSKEVVDADGFTTDYTMYFDKDEHKYIFMFGDKEVYTPADDYADWMTEDEEIANSWFDHYIGFNEDEEEPEEEQKEVKAQNEAYASTEIRYHYVLRYDGGIEPVYYATGERFVDDVRDASVCEYDIYSDAAEDIEDANDAWIHEADFEDELEELDGDYDALYEKFVKETGGFKPYRVIDEKGMLGDTDDDAPEGFDSVVEESLTEDTVKQGSKWVNKGKEGTHGRFKTKKEADAQRRAMFAQGYKEEMEDDLSESFEDEHLGTLEDIDVEDDFDDIDEIQLVDLDEECESKKSFSALEDVRSTLAKQPVQKVAEQKNPVNEMTQVDECEDCEDLDDLN